MPLKRPRSENSGNELSWNHADNSYRQDTKENSPPHSDHHFEGSMGECSEPASERESRRRRCRRQAAPKAEPKSQSTLRREEQQGKVLVVQVGSKQQDDIVGKVRRSGERRGELAEGAGGGSVPRVPKAIPVTSRSE